jgi:hypothetical protein
VIVRARTLLVAVVLGFACAAVVACGGDRSGLLPSSNAERLQADLDNLENVVQSGSCDQVSTALQRLQDDLVQVPSTVDVELRNRIQEGVATLLRQAPEECQARAADDEPTDTTTETTDTETQTTTTETETTTTETDTTPTDTTTTETTPTDTTPTETTPPPTEGTGGAGVPPGGTP